MSQRYGAPMAQVYVDAYVRRWPRTSVAISLGSSRERLFDVDRDDAAELARRVAEWAAENLMVPALRARYRLGCDRGREPDRRAGRRAAPAGFRRRRVAGGGHRRRPAAARPGSHPGQRDD